MATDDRCYACCQENCGYRRCYCSCHGPTPRETDCPRGIHVAELHSCTLGDPDSAKYWCMHCGTMTDDNGKELAGTKLALELRCPKHPKYQAKRKPRAICETCDLMWEKNQR